MSKMPERTKTTAEPKEMLLSQIAPDTWEWTVKFGDDAPDLCGIASSMDEALNLMLCATATGIPS